MKGRVQVQAITPSVDGGRYAAKAIVGDEVAVGADVFREGHDKVAACVRYRGPDDDRWSEAPLRLDVNDRFHGVFPVDRVGAWRYAVVGWTDHYASWLDGFTKKVVAGRTHLELDAEEGALLLERRRVPRAARAVLDQAAALLRASDAGLVEKVSAASDPDLVLLLDRNPERLDATVSKPELRLWVDREAAQFTAWYEFFPRSEGAVAATADQPGESGSFADAAKRLPAIAEMGFDVVYLPPIHPIGIAYRKGRNNTLVPEPGDPGVPWAIGGAEGGHTAVHPDLGTIQDFDDFVEEAGRHGLEVALDFAIQCSPDHPWVREHPDWFRHRSDGSIAYAENPPKQYQDIYPIDFDTRDLKGLKAELKGVLDFWIGHGIQSFRVDNPHTKAIPFWEWLIDAIHAEHPDVLFLAEAFTRPKMMQTLAKIGFSQSYTYFAWRNSKEELTEYLTELSQTEMADYFRPSFWPNTPDILTEYLQLGGLAPFKVRLVLAALLSPAYGLYSGYELGEHLPIREGSEEYLDSEKYQYKPRDWSRVDSLAPYITRVNRIRSTQPAMRGLRGLWFHHVDNDHLLCFSKVTPQRTDPVLVVVNLDPYTAQAGMTWLDLWQLGLEGTAAYEARDLMTGATYHWRGADNFVRLDPWVEPVNVFALRAH
jgi:starch synthase (maltosyl-transferring)